MEEPHLWVIDRDGRAFIVNLRNNSWKQVSTPELKSRNCFKRISATNSCAWAINANQQPCLFVHSTQVSIRNRAETWENQRYGWIHGWSEKSMLRSDRPNFSSKDGKVHLPKSGFPLPSKHWVWEGDWTIDQSIPCDSEGWQYAIDFPRTYYDANSSLHCARRRCWARYYKFGGYDKWLLISGLTEDPVKQPFQDIAVGGTMIPGHKPGQLSVWAVTFHGQVLFRAGITHKNPEGSSWQEVPPPNGTITQLSVSRTGILWGVTWEGIAIVRVGVSYDLPTGSDWIEINPPSLSANGEICPLLQIAAGVNGLWALTKDEQVWYRKGINTSNVSPSTQDITGKSWIQMVGRFLLLSVGPNDQVFGLSTCGDHIYFRTEVKPDELCGREWCVLRTSRIHDNNMQKISSGFEDDIFSSSTEDHSLPRNVEFLTWVNSGACDVDAAFFNGPFRGLVPSFSTMSLSTQDSRDATWRNEIISQLRERDQQECNKFGMFEEAISQGSWSKKARCQILMDSQYNLWCDSLIKLSQQDKETTGDLICYYEKISPYQSYGELRIPFKEISCVNIVHTMARHNCLAISVLHGTLENSPLAISFSNEKELNDWLSCLYAVTTQAHGCHGTVSPNALWAVSSCGDVFASAYQDNSSSERFWRQIGGHLFNVETGSSGIVWGIGFDGHPYVYTGGYGGGVLGGFSSSSFGLHPQEDYNIHYIYENQRWNPIEGFSERRLPSDRYVWSDKSGVYEQSKEGFLLPSSQWQWVGQWQVDTRPDVTDKEGWQYAVDFPRQYHPVKYWNDYVRRRRWKRRSKLTTSGPWLAVTPTVKLRDVSVQMDQNADQHISVWAVTSQGDVLFRHGVSKDCPQGVSWEHIIADVPFISISIGGNGRSVWGVAQNGTTYFRAGFSENKRTGNCWFHIGEKPPYLTQISAGKSCVWARDKYDGLWYRINITDTYPEGTEWKQCDTGVSYISAGPSDQLYVCHEGNIKKKLNADIEDTEKNQYEPTLSENWWSICARADYSPADDNPVALIDNHLENLEEVEKGVDVLAEVPREKTGTHREETNLSPIRMSGSIFGVEESHIGGPMSLQTNIDLSEVDIYTAFKHEKCNDTEDDIL